LATNQERTVSGTDVALPASVAEQLQYHCRPHFYSIILSPQIGKIAIGSGAEFLLEHFVPNLLETRGGLGLFLRADSEHLYASGGQRGTSRFSRAAGPWRLASPRRINST
jgi:hypothetical protein